MAAGDMLRNKNLRSTPMTDVNGVRGHRLMKVASAPEPSVALSGLRPVTDPDVRQWLDELSATSTSGAAAAGAPPVLTPERRYPDDTAELVAARRLSDAAKNDEHLAYFRSHHVTFDGREFALLNMSVGDAADLSARIAVSPDITDGDVRHITMFTFQMQAGIFSPALNPSYTPETMPAADHHEQLVDTLVAIVDNPSTSQKALHSMWLQTVRDAAWAPYVADRVVAEIEAKGYGARTGRGTR